MLVGICHLELYLTEGGSLKEKRQVIKSIIDKLRNRFNISIAEIGCQDNIRKAEIGFSVVSNESAHLDSLMEKAINFIDNNGRVEIVNIDREII